MLYLPLPDNAARQIIDSSTVFGEWRRAVAQARPYSGGMYFKKEGEYEYLVKTHPNNRQERMGRRSPETEQILERFTTRKQEAEARSKSLRDALREAQRMNKAVKAGRVPDKVIAVLNALDEAGLLDHFTVVGTHALYAYESAAGVRIVPGALATQDVDLLWDARRRMQFLSTMGRLDKSMLQVLQSADRSFRRKDGQAESAIDDKGFEVDFLRREHVGDDPHPFRFTDDENDLWPMQAERAAVLTSAPRFEHVVISSTGRMALMRTIAPAAFVEFKRWMSTSASHRPAAKRRRDALQADIVQKLLDEGLLVAAEAAAGPEA